MRPVIAITMGDPAGVGAEIAVRALAAHPITDICRPFVIGDGQAMLEALRFTGCGSLRLRTISDPQQAAGEPGVLDLLDMKLLAAGGWAYGAVSAACGEAAFRYIEKSIGFAMAGAVHAVATGPINKQALNKAGHHYAGHTEIFAQLTGGGLCAMLLCSRRLKVIHCTTHVAMREACGLVTTARVVEVIRLAHEAMRLLGKPGAAIAVAGLNPHAGEDGLFGDEEARWIAPAVAQAKGEGLNVTGPLPPDTVFVKAMAGEYDIVVAMYHDQGHIPVKLSAFELDPATGRFTAMGGVNTTIGLPVIRTSVDHGTAFDRAGKGTANEESLVDAIEMAAAMATHKFGLSK